MLLEYTLYTRFEGDFQGRLGNGKSPGSRERAKILYRKGLNNLQQDFLRLPV